MTQPEPADTVAVWYLHLGRPDYMTEPDEHAAAESAATMDVYGDDDILGIQFADGRLIEANQWPAYKVAREAAERRYREAMAKQQASPGPTRQIIAPFVNTPMTVHGPDAPPGSDCPLRRPTRDRPRRTVEHRRVAAGAPVTYSRMSIPSGSPTGSPFDPQPRLYALLAVEVEPGKIAYYHLELDHHPGACEIEIERETEHIHTWDSDVPLRALDVGPIHIRAQLSGTVVSDRPDYRPPTRTNSTTGRAVLADYNRPVFELEPGAVRD